MDGVKHHRIMLYIMALRDMQASAWLNALADVWTRCECSEHRTLAARLEILNAMD